MTAFRFKAYDVQGRLQKGVQEADTPRQVRALLRERGLLASDITAISHGISLSKADFVWKRGMNGSQLSMVTRQFATLLSAGMPVEQALNALIDQVETDRERNVLAGVRSEILAGQPLASAMRKFPNDFSELYVTLISAGEQSGKLGEVMERLADYIESRQIFRQKVVTALLYPMIVTVVAVMVVLGLLVYVVPQVVQVFQDTNQTLPLLTRALIWGSDMLKSGGMFILAALLLILWQTRRLLRSDVRREKLHRWLLRLPAIGTLIRGINSAQFSSTLGILVGSGVPLLAALNAGSGVIGNLPMRKAVEQAANKVREGAGLARSLGAAKLFPPLLVHMIAVGEASGRLVHMLERAASQQSREIEGRIIRITGLLEPLLILVMGSVVLLIVLAVLLPIFEMNQMVRL